MRSRFVLLALLAVAPAAAQKTTNVVLVTVDGVRQQELYEGADAIILDSGEASGITNVERVSERFWRATPEQRRETLLPFFWTELVPSGVLLRSTIANPHRNSFPGYSELLTGRVVPEITGNIDLQNPAETVLQIARRQLDVGRLKVAAFTSWEHFSFIVENEPGTIFVNAGARDVEPGIGNLAMERWNGLQRRLPSPWDGVRYNAVTLGLATEYLELYRPRVLFIALDETDEWAHSRRYDRVLSAIRQFDDALRELWSKLQSLDDYRDRTTLIVTTDHGRGLTPRDWTSHGADIDAAKDTWIAIMGPDTSPRGSVLELAENGEVAATILALLGLDPEMLGSGAGRPIDFATR